MVLLRVRILGLLGLVLLSRLVPLRRLLLLARLVPLVTLVPLGCLGRLGRGGRISRIMLGNAIEYIHEAFAALLGALWALYHHSMRKKFSVGFDRDFPIPTLDFLYQRMDESVLMVDRPEQDRGRRGDLRRALFPAASRVSRTPTLSANSAL